MKLPFASLFQKKEPADYFLALLFRDEEIHAVVFEQINNRVQVVGQGKTKLSTSLDRASDEMLLDSCDRAISVAEESLPNGVTTHKTVFGVKETWVEDTHITQQYLSRLKTISEQLDLKPIGFLVFPEAIAHLLQREEGAPVSAILVELGAKQASITLIRAGRIVGTKEVQLEESAMATVENALRQFENVEILPSRIVLFNTGDNSVEKKFLTHKWSKSLPFLHVPQVTTLPGDFDTRAILFGTATQMGLDAIDLVKQPLKKAEEFFEEPSETKEPEETKEEETVILGSETTPESTKELEEDAGQASMTNEDERQAPASEDKEKEELEEVSGKDTSEYFGFVKGTDIAQKIDHPHTTSLPSKDIDEITAEIPEEEKEEELAGSAPGFSMAGPIFVEGAKKVYAQVRRFLPRQFTLAPVMNLFSGLPKGNGGIPKLFIFVPLAIVVVVLLFLWYIFSLHAKVTIFLTPKTISQDKSVTFTTTGSTDASKNLIAADSVTTTEDGKVSGNATGTKDVGTPAKGTVTVFNSDDSSHTLSSGTTITSSSGPKFTLDKDVTVASASSDPFEGTKPSTADVPVTASSIGTESNLPSNTKFTISGTSVLAAKNANAFSGGTKKSITVVSQKDLDTLTAQLTDNLKDKAKSDLQSKVSGDAVILPDFTKTAPTKTLFDKKVGDESSSINLDGSITYTTISYKKSDIENYTKSALSGQLPSDLTLSQEGITYSVKDMTTKDDTTKATLSLKALLIPTLDTKTLASQIAGKSFDQARDILSATPQFSDVTTTLSPNLFFLPKVLPRLSGNITITIVAHE
ncbi:MAG TPA: baseplate J/gp47 family protein [Candidatus Eisenbacteria bacterium]|nr:baseplate J/gp47 family protein [Candidatus Eisenbacteria bacterium]